MTNMENLARPKKGASQLEEALASDLKRLKVNVENLDTILDKTADRQNQHAQDFAKDAVQETGEVIRRSPLAAVATALGLGFLFGLFKRRG